jgi:hypothetical protein
VVDPGLSRLREGDEKSDFCDSENLSVLDVVAVETVVCDEMACLFLIPSQSIMTFVQGSHVTYFRRGPRTPDGSRNVHVRPNLEHLLHGCISSLEDEGPLSWCELPAAGKD